MITTMSAEIFFDPACGSSPLLVAGPGTGKMRLFVDALSLSLLEVAHHGTAPNIFLSFNSSLTEKKAELRQKIRKIESTITLYGSPGTGKTRLFLNALSLLEVARHGRATNIFSSFN